MSEWKECKLEEVSSIKGGKRLPKGKTLIELPTKHPYIRTRDINGHKIAVNELLYVPDDVFPSIKNYIVEKDDVIISIVGTIGLCAIVPTELHLANLTENCAKIVNLNDNKIEKKFLFYYLISSDGQDEIEQRNVGSTQPKLPLYNIKDIPVPLPPLSEQKAIAVVLSSLDDKIDLLHRQNKTLEAMAETLFRQWFVEEAQEDWEDRCLGDIADINPTCQLKKGEISTYVEMKNISTSTFNPKGWYKRKFTSGMKFQNGDTLLARITPCLENGKTCFVTFLDEEEVGWGSTEYIVMRMKEPFHPYISYIIAKDKDFRDFAISSMSGSSGRQRAQVNVIKEYDIKVPPLEITEKLNRQLAGILPKLKNNANQIRTLEKLRNTLLPKLMSGEVRVQYDKEATV
jgi:type I restriction enzyme S subunit